MLLKLYVSSVLLLFFTSELVSSANSKDGYYGKSLGKLSQLHHGVSGEVFAVDARTLHIKNFNYDGEGPAAYFYVGTSKTPSGNGIRIRDERGTTNVLPRYRNKDITLTLPDGKTLQNIRWFSVWCDEFAVNFGDVKIQKNFDFPRPQKLGSLGGIHGVSSDPVVVVDAQTLLVPNFSYDGEAPDAKFWVGRGSKPTPQGIRVPDENGKEVPLRRYDRKTIVLTLPGDLTVFDIGHFGVWCEAFTVDFGHVQIPHNLNIPPSLKMLGVSPQSKLNCEVLWDDLAFEVRWAVAGDSIVLQLVARLDNGEYMSFGLSGDDTNSQMVGGDVTVAWVDKDTLKGHAYDYYLDAKSQCSGGRGSCPDEKLADRANSVRLLNAALVNGYSIVTYQRSLKAHDEYDRVIYTNGSQPVIWAFGPLNSRKEVSYHSLTSKGNVFLDFGRPPKWNCPTPESHGDGSREGDKPQVSVSVSTSHSTGEEESRISERLQTNTKKQSSSSSRREPQRAKTQVPTPAPAPKVTPWDIPAIQCHEPEDGVFYAQMGPTGGKRGYPAITGHVGWGIAWYVNGLLIPEINVVRGRTYTFIVEGGLDANTPARYHPFYITDDPIGGYEYKTPEERANIQIFAGAVQNKRGEVRPTGVGRLCNWTPDQTQPLADEFSSFGAYQRTLKLECDEGEPGIVQWTVEDDTPDTVYYQCYTHRYLGWKINVLDSCDTDGQFSEPVPARVKAPERINKIEKKHLVREDDDQDVEDSDARPSIQYATKVKPDNSLHSKQVVTDKPTLQQLPQVTFIPEIQFVNEETGEPLGPPQSFQHINMGGLTHHIFQQFPENVNQQPYLQQLVKPDLAVQPATTNIKEAQKFFQLFQQPSQQHSYSVREPTIEEEQKNAKYHLVPKQSHEASDQNLFPNDLSSRRPVIFEYQTTPVADTVNKPTSTEILRDIQKFNEESFKKMQFLKQKMPYLLNAATNKLPNPQIIQHRPQYNIHALQRKPQPHPAFTLQQRPLPPGMFRPPFMPPPGNLQIMKKPYYPVYKGVPSQKLNVYSSPNTLQPGWPTNLLRQQQQQQQQMFIQKKPTLEQAAQKLQQEMKLQQQIKLQQFLNLQKQIQSISTENPALHMKLLEAIPHHHFPNQMLDTRFIKPEKLSIPLQLAINSGFNPSSVKVEGGFKPILNTGIGPKLEKRMDDDGNNDDDIGVIDLTRGIQYQGEKSALFKDNKTELILEEQEINQNTQERKIDDNFKNDLFKGQKPEMFEPMFIPSPPDHRIQYKYDNEEKRKKKPINTKDDLGERNSMLQFYNSAKQNSPVKLRPRPNLIRRPLYPSNVVPPFKIPTRGGAPQYRFKQTENSEEVEETTDFDIIKVSDSNETETEQPHDTAENIFEIIQMEEQQPVEQKTEVIVLNPDDGSIFDAQFETSNKTDEVAMAAEKQETFYLPPSDIVTYDGKPVSGALSPAALPRISLSQNTADFIRRTPQFKPFRGDIPPALGDISPSNLPQLKSVKTAQKELLPFPDPPSIESTKLSLVKQEAAPSETHQVVVEPDVEVTNESKVGEVKQLDSSVDHDRFGEKELKREKRSPHHEPGHIGGPDDGHSHSNSASMATRGLFFGVAVVLSLTRIL